MSQETKKEVIEIKKTFERISKEVDDAGKRAGTLGDKDLSQKIQRIKEGSTEVVKHIEERSGKNG